MVSSSDALVVPKSVFDAAYVGLHTAHFTGDCADVFLFLRGELFGRGLLLALQFGGAGGHLLLGHADLFAEGLGIGFSRLHALGEIGNFLLARRLAVREFGQLVMRVIAEKCGRADKCDGQDDEDPFTDIASGFGVVEIGLLAWFRHVCLGSDGLRYAYSL